MDQNQNQLSLTDNKDVSEQEAVKEYVDAIENNIEYFKEWCAIYKTQKELAQQKVSFLEMKVAQLTEIIRQYQNGTI
jgi:cell division septum initiation protein DivIVA